MAHHIHQHSAPQEKQATPSGTTLRPLPNDRPDGASMDVPWPSHIGASTMTMPEFNQAD